MVKARKVLRIISVLIAGLGISLFAAVKLDDWKTERARRTPIPQGGLLCSAACEGASIAAYRQGVFRVSEAGSKFLFSPPYEVYGIAGGGDWAATYSLDSLPNGRPAAVVSVKEITLWRRHARWFADAAWSPAGTLREPCLSMDVRGSTLLVSGEGELVRYSLPLAGEPQLVDRVEVPREYGLLTTVQYSADGRRVAAKTQNGVVLLDGDSLAVISIAPLDRPDDVRFAGDVVVARYTESELVPHAVNDEDRENKFVVPPKADWVCRERIARFDGSTLEPIEDEAESVSSP